MIMNHKLTCPCCGHLTEFDLSIECYGGAAGPAKADGGAGTPALSPTQPSPEHCGAGGGTSTAAPATGGDGRQDQPLSATPQSERIEQLKAALKQMSSEERQDAFVTTV
jgi:hypothetical protein